MLSFEQWEMEQESLALLVRLDTNKQAIDRLRYHDYPQGPVIEALVNKLVAAETEIKELQTSKYYA